MDRKSLIVLLLSFGLLMMWYPLVNKMFPPLPAPQLTNQPPASAISTGALSTAISQDAGAANTNRSGQTAAAPAPAAIPAGPEETLAFENDVARYTLTSRGGGIKLVELKKYPAVVRCDDDKATNEFQPATLNTRAPLPSLISLGDPALENSSYRLTRTASGARAEAVLPSGLQVVKEFAFVSNYVVKTTVRLQNLTNHPLSLNAQEWVIGTATPIGQKDESLHVGFQWYNGSKTEHITEAYFANRTLGCIPGRPRSEYVAGASNVVWGAVHNQFFALIVVPNTPALQVVGRKVSLPPPTTAEIAANPSIIQHPAGYQASLVYPSAVLAPAQSLERSFDVYAGPKEYNTLARLGNNLDAVMNFGFFGFFAKGLLLAMNGLHHATTLSYGVTIVVITVIIKLLFWPLTAASTKSMKRMAALQPQMKLLQEKYKDDPKKLNQKMMEFWKEHKVNPMGGCLPMLLQIPVFIGFYTMLQSAIELRGAEFLWACDLSQPDTVAVIPGFHFPINPMPLLMGFTMIWQARLTPLSPGMDPMQQKIMKYMPLMFMVFLYNYSAGLTLYWTVQNLLTIAQMKVTKASDEKQKKAGNGDSPAPRPVAPKKQK